MKTHNAAGSPVLAGTNSKIVTSKLVDATYSRITWRLLPSLFICYVAAYLDRVNVGFAKLQMLNDLTFSEAVCGLGAGVLFIGYFPFEVPSGIGWMKEVTHSTNVGLVVAAIALLMGFVLILAQRSSSKQS